ncbi:ComE operon protein 1 [Frondihabitans sp. 762G35]|nr:ComE operon protein 1 [Frondihabitans sp. 762G35]
MAVLVLLAIGIALSAASSARGSSALQEVRPPSSGHSGRLSGAPTPSPTSAPTASATVFVHIVGRVASPGLYEVPAGSRAVTVVEAAGGFAESADQGALNLARPVVDGEQIVVTAVGEAPPAPAPGSPAAAGTGAHTVSGPVDLNAADAAALETLRGVGPATAEAILAWRDEHGRFESVDDLLDVPGIGEKKLDALRDAVAVR